MLAMLIVNRAAANSPSEILRPAVIDERPAIRTARSAMLVNINRYNTGRGTELEADSNKAKWSEATIINAYSAVLTTLSQPMLNGS